MTHLDISWGPPSVNHPSGVPDALIDMIEESPDLNELSLDISGYHLGQAPTLQWRPSELFRVLKNPLSKLCHLTMRGAGTLDWGEFVQDSPGACPLRSFFEQHPHLHGIHLDWKQDYQPGPVVNPAVMARLFPSLKHFTGPSTMCTALLNSKLAEQLETLHVRLESRVGSDSAATQIDFPCVLPRLREFGFASDKLFSTHLESRTLHSDTLTKLLTMTPSLTLLNILHLNIELAELVEPLRQVPLLTELILRTDEFGPFSLQGAISAKLVIFKLMRTCPMLQRVCFWTDGKGLRTLLMRRVFDGTRHIYITVGA